MVKIRDLFHFVPRRYRYYPYLVFVFICSLIFFIYSHHSSELEPAFEPKVNVTTTTTISTTTDDNNNFDLFDDDDIPLICPSDIQFNISNRRYLAIIVAPTLVPFLWKNFRALLCTGVDAYVMLDKVFLINSSLREDYFPPRTNRSKRSYTHRFLYISNETLAKYGVKYMKKFPSIEFSSWDRAVVWLYHRRYLANAWVMDYAVQWLHVENMTYLFDRHASDKADILCGDIIRTNSPHWQQWPNKQSDIFPQPYWTGTYSPLVRWSRRLLFHHYQYMQLIHVQRLQYEFDKSFRFQEFIMGTIAKTEKLSVNLYNNKQENFIQLNLEWYTDKSILSLLREGKYIIYPVMHNSILTEYPTNEIAEMMHNMTYDFNLDGFIRPKQKNYTSNLTFTAKSDTHRLLSNNIK